ncbi:E3 ubiquitin/ISG15 ligase TRIM25 isoform X2 [Engraulis encrasicolus]|uniref:E3 ubiquitin/ISG15 ligase TRIM25 isoform X2 n=1 Tax=Engraulis encrasicolus TaxID=184585 RepID=UPI002FD6D23D
MAEDLPSLLSLEDELTCSICLCTFENPVTIPCGHNFCQGCLDETWKESFLLFCPQCRHQYETKPILKKNTVISAVVATFKLRSSSSELDLSKMVLDDGGEEEKKIKKEPDVKCDTCMEAAALKTCLTCMASFCVEHVKPHQENPIFRSHQLAEPLGDLQERICQDHCKIMEFFCQTHGCSICSACLQQVHRGCDYTSPQEKRDKKETELKGMLTVMSRKIDKNNIVMAQMKEQQLQLQDDGNARKKMLSAEYQLIRDLIDRDEQQALKAVDKEMESGQAKLQSLLKKFGQNVQKMTQTKAEINRLLTSADTLSFLQASVELPANANFEPYCPKVNVDSKAVIAYHSSVVAVKDLLNKILATPVESRISVLKPDFERDVLGKVSSDPPEGSTLRPGPPERGGRGGPPRNMRSPSPGASLRAGNGRFQPPPHHPPLYHPHFQQPPFHHPLHHPPPHHYPPHHQPPHHHPPGKKPGNPKTPKGDQNKGKKKEKTPKPDPSTRVPAGDPCPPDNLGEPPSVPRDVSNAVKRSDLLKFGTVLKLDPRSAHKRIGLSEDFTKASVAEEPCPYPDGPERFSVCSQVLCSKGFERGRHYWEVKMSSNNFCGLGLAYGRVDRKGPASRLGRNADSWCVEWFNVKLSAWHDSAETVLQNPNPSRVGVLLDCDAGSATFYSVDGRTPSTRAYPFHTFVFPFQEAVYPAFWIFSQGSSISLCKLTA